MKVSWTGNMLQRGETIHRVMMLEQGEADSKNKMDAMDSAVELSHGHGEQTVRLPSSSEKKDHSLEMLCQRLKVELNKQKCAKTLLAEQLCTLQEQHKEADELRRQVDSADMERERMREEFSFTRDESSKLPELVNTLSDELHRKELEFVQL